MIRIPGLATTCALALGLVGGMAISGHGANATPTAIQLDGDRHPEIHRALDALHNAHDALWAADRDFDGHRTAAAHDVDAAVAECQICLTIDH